METTRYVLRVDVELEDVEFEEGFMYSMSDVINEFGIVWVGPTLSPVIGLGQDLPLALEARDALEASLRSNRHVRFFRMTDVTDDALDETKPEPCRNWTVVFRRKDK